MRMLRWMSGLKRMGCIQNDKIREKVGVAPIDEKVHEGHFRRYGHIFIIGL